MYGLGEGGKGVRRYPFCEVEQARREEGAGIGDLQNLPNLAKRGRSGRMEAQNEPVREPGAQRDDNAQAHADGVAQRLRDAVDEPPVSTARAEIDEDIRVQLGASGHRRPAGPLTRATTSETMVSGSAIRPSPTFPDASGPRSGPTTCTPRARSRSRFSRTGAELAI